MKARRFTAIVLLFFVFPSLFYGCSPDGDKNQEESVIFQSKVVDLVSAVVGEQSEVYAATFDSGIARYTSEGDLLEKYPDTEGIYGLCLDGDFIYGYREFTHEIVEFSPKSKELRTIYTGLKVEQIRNIAVVDGFVFLITVPSFEGLSQEQQEDGFMDFNEKFFSIDIQSGNLTEITEIPHPIALYKGSDGNLYVYSHPDRSYVLYKYDAGKKLSQVAVMDDVGYLFAFAYEDDSFTYFSSSGNVQVKRMSDGLIYTGADIVPLALDNCFAYYNGSLIFLEMMQSDDPNVMPDTSIRTLVLDKEFAKLQYVDGNSDKDGIEYQGNIVISASPSNKLLSTDILKTRSGISASYSEQPVNNNAKFKEFLTSILAGDDKVDIYILRLNSDVSRALREQGGYVPLTDSSSIQTYLNECFDWVGDVAKTSDGDIWMLPLYFNLPALWYVPKNYARFNITPSDTAYFDDFLQTVERLNEVKDKYTTHTTYFVNYEYIWSSQYETVYCDYENNKVAFDTDLYKSYFEKIWGGWHRYGNPDEKTSAHPILQYDREYKSHIDLSEDYFSEYDPERLIFKLDYLSQILEDPRSDITKLRALPFPRLTADVNHNYTIGTYAVINPYSKNKELALAYLEAAAEDMLSAVNKAVFVQKDASAYAEYFDMSLPVFQDIHNLYREGAVVKDVFGMNDTQHVIDEYQDGKITLQEAVDEIQRKAEFWLNE